MQQDILSLFFCLPFIDPIFIEIPYTKPDVDM